MEESSGKAWTRALYYQTILPSWLGADAVRSGNHLVLLGDEPRELPLLDALGVPRHRIHSVEYNRDVFARQRGWNTRVSLYPFEMRQFLRLMLHQEQTFINLNLDIEGSYLKNLDPAMSQVLLFCWRNSQTVVATYSTIGHDHEQLMEGVLSYLLLVALLPEETKQLTALLTTRYAAARYMEPLRMALRDFFWLRSNLEHALVTTMLVEAIAPQELERFFILEQLLIEELRARAVTPLALGEAHRLAETVINSAAYRRRIGRLSLPGVGLTLGAMNIVYRAVDRWSHRCYFARYDSRAELIDCRAWLRQALQLFVEPLIFVDRDGLPYRLAHSGVELAKETILWPDERLYGYQFRRLEKYPDVRPLQPTILAIQRRRAAGFSEISSSDLASMVTNLAIPIQEGGEEEMTTQRKKKRSPGTNGTTRTSIVIYVREGKFTDEAKEQIRTWARAGLKTAEIMKLLPRSAKGLRASVTAYVATANR